MEPVQWSDAELQGFYERGYDNVPEPEQFQRMPLSEMLIRKAHNEQDRKRQQAFTPEVAVRNCSVARR